MNKFLFLITFFSIFQFYGQSLDSIQKLDEIVVTGTKYPIAKKYSGKIIAQISKEELAQNPHKSVAQVLNELAGFEMNGSKSAPGKNIGAYVEGGKAGQILVIVDGIPLIDPSGIDMSYDLNMLSTNQIESIEVMRGAAGTLYGSGAATAVISIKTMEHSAQRLAVEAGTTWGTNRNQQDGFVSGSQWTQNLNVNGKVDDFNYLISYNGTNTKGLSTASSLNQDFKENPFDKQHILGKFGFQITPKLNMGLIANYSNATHQFDQDAFTDSEVNKSDAAEFRMGFHTKYAHRNGNFQMHSEYKSADRNYLQFNSWTALMDDFQYHTNSFQTDLFHLYRVSEHVDLLSGLNHQFHQTDNETPYGNISSKMGRFNSVDPYLNLNLKDIHGFNLSVGSRLNMHSVYGSHATFSLNPSFHYAFSNENELRLMSSWSSAYIVPSIYQLHSAYGNVDLKPEITETLEFGLDYAMGKNTNFSILYFDRKEQNAIVFETDPNTWVSQYQNDADGKVFVSGIETGFGFSPLESLVFRTNYTFTKTSKERPYSVPKHKWNAKMQYKALKNTQLMMNYQYTSDRTQLDFSNFPYVSKTLHNYHILNFSVMQPLWDNRLSLNFAVDNIFNVDYVETIGYTTMGRNFVVGVKYGM